MHSDSIDSQKRDVFRAIVSDPDNPLLYKRMYDLMQRVSQRDVWWLAACHDPDEDSVPANIFPSKAFACKWLIGAYGIAMQRCVSYAYSQVPFEFNMGIGVELDPEIQALAINIGWRLEQIGAPGVIRGTPEDYIFIVDSYQQIQEYYWNTNNMATFFMANVWPVNLDVEDKDG